MSKDQFSIMTPLSRIVCNGNVM